MSQSVEDIFSKIIKDLLARGIITQQKSITIVPPNSKIEIVNVLMMEATIDPDQIAISIANVRQIDKLLTAKDIDLRDVNNHSETTIVSPKSDSTPWIIYKKVLYVSNPWDVETVSPIGTNSEQASLYNEVGILSLSVTSSPIWTKEADTDEDDATDEISKTQSIMKFKELMSMGIERGASDIHLQPNSRGEIDVRMRIDGYLTPVGRYSQDIHLELLRHLFLDVANKNFNPIIPEDARFDYEDPVTKQSTSVRVNTLPQKRGPRKTPRCVMRLFSSKSNFTELSSLNLSSHVSKALSEAAAQPQGLILVTGPTGSGKSTTLFSLLNDIHHREPELNIMTIENPVEQEAEAFSQIEVDDNMDFAQALRALLRQDPNIILVGEIRDKETAEVSINAALTGHLVLSTIHTRNAHLALDRLRELGINPGVIAEACLAITAQRLPRKICPNCRVQVYLKDRKDLYDRYKDDPFIKERPNFSFYEANEDGCDKCSGGYKGVCSAVELLSVDSYMEDAIRSGTSATEVRKSQIKDRSFTDIWGDAFRLIEEGSCDFATLEKAIGSYATARNI